MRGCPLTISEEIPLEQLRRFRKDLALYRLENFWGISLPGLDSIEVKSILDRFVQNGSRKNELAAMLDKAKSMDVLGKEDLNRMIRRGLTPEQVNLYIQSTPAERKLLAGEWRSDLAAKLQRVAPMPRNPLASLPPRAW